VLGEEHPATLNSISFLGYCLQNIGKTPEAEPLIREGLEKNRRILGEEHPETLTALGNLGSVLQALGKLSEAEPIYRKVLEGRRRVLGEEHPSTLTSLNNLGKLLQNEGRFAESEPLVDEALRKRLRVLGEEHPETIMSLSLLASLKLDQGRPHEALELISRYQATARKQFTGDNARRLADFLVALGRAQAGVGFDAARFALAEAHLLEAHAIYLGVKDRGPGHTDTLKCVQALIDFYTSWDRCDPGNGYAEKAAHLQAKLDGARGQSPGTPGIQAPKP
jgi:tetratricopeptide (TPR) repeat protein